MDNIRFFFLFENFHFLVVKFSIYSNRRVFVMWFSIAALLCVCVGGFMCVVYFATICSLSLLLLLP